MRSLLPAFPISALFHPHVSALSPHFHPSSVHLDPSTCLVRDTTSQIIHVFPDIIDESVTDYPACTVDNHVSHRPVVTSPLLTSVFVLTTYNLRVYRITLTISYPTDAQYGDSLPTLLPLTVSPLFSHRHAAAVPGCSFQS
jgi:hypothetical protein